MDLYSMIWLLSFRFYRYNTMVNSVSFVSTGTFNHVFPSLPMHTLLSSKFPREIKTKDFFVF
jgi:hypothetical protein